MHRFLLQLLLILVSVVTGLAAHPKVSRDIHNGPSGSNVDVIIQYKRMPQARHHALVTSRGGSHKRDLGAIHGAHYSVPVNALDHIANDPDVVGIHPDRTLNALNDVTVATTGANLASGFGLDGAGIGVAVIDSGIVNDHPDLKGRVVYEQNFAAGDTKDHYGHGSHVAGIIGGNGNKSSGLQYSRFLRGIAPNVNFIDLRALDATGAGSDSNVIAAITTAINLRAKYNIRVLNLSLGRGLTGSQ